ncbi:hypothetical protein BC833DRAFT_626607 [Globomyces pollinis-pini]|nr:hypothetical protein BC833DRAFT_626607 [Globomyces pollinis-pini]
MIKLLALCSSVFAAAIDSNGGLGVRFDNRPWVILYAIVFIALGILLIFFGLKLFRIMLFIVGFIFFSDLTSIIIDKADVYFDQGSLIRKAICFGVGILGGILARYVWRVGITLVGYLAGFQLALMTCTLKQGFFFENTTIYLIILIGCGLVGVVVVHMIEKPSLIVGTSVIGTFMIISSVDSLLRIALRFGDYSPAGFLLLLAGTGLGVAYQYHTTKELKYRDP